MSIQIKDNLNNDAEYVEGTLLKRKGDNEYGILIKTNVLEEKYNVLLLSTSLGYPETAFTKEVSLNPVKEFYTPVTDKYNYDLTLTIGKE